MLENDEMFAWSTLRKGDVVLTNSQHVNWVVIIVLEDAFENSVEGTLVFRIFDNAVYAGRRVGVHRIRSDNDEIDRKIWDVIRYNATA